MLKIKINSEKINNLSAFLVMCVVLLLKSIVFLFLVKPNFYAEITETAINGALICIYISFIVLVSAPYFLIKNKKRIWYLYFINLFFAILFFADLIYFKGFDNFMSLFHIKEIVNISEAKSGAISLITPKLFLIFLDNIIFLPICILITKTNTKIKRSPLMFVSIILFCVGCFYNQNYINIYNGVRYKPISTIAIQSPIGYHFYDIYAYLKYETDTPTKEDADTSDKWLAENKETLPDNKYKGIFKEKNLLAIQFESLEEFVINEKVDGQEITPNLNKLLKNSLYFSNYREIVNGGGSSDAEFISNTSIYPIRTGATAFLYPNMQYKSSLPNILKDNGYNTYIYHSDNFTFWNWGQINKSIGFEHLYQESDYNGDEYTSMGLTDGCYLNKATEFIEKQKQPFYSFVVTMTSHTPFKLPDQYNELKLDDSINNTKLGDYFQAIHYTDKQLGIMLDKLDKDGVLNNTVVTVHGDHTGVHRFFNNEINQMTSIPNKWKEVNLKVPLIVYQKDYSNPESINTFGNQTDYLPTMSYLLGIDDSYYKDGAMGKVLVNTNKNYTLINSGIILSDKNVDEKEKEHILQSYDVSEMLIKINNKNK